MKWDDDLLLEGEIPPERGQLQLAMYAVHLSSGQGIYCRQLKVKTIENYVYNVASFLALFGGKDFRKDSPSDRHMGRLLSGVYRDLASYESLPSRREPYTLQMQAVAAREATPYDAIDPCTIIPVLIRAFGTGINTGFRLSEWAQPAGTRDPASPQLNHLKEGIRTRAVVPVDFRALSHSYQRGVGLAILDISLCDISRLWIKYRTQKNGQHGEERMMVPGPDLASPHDAVACFYGLLKNFRELQTRDPSLREDFTPLAIYWDTDSACIRLVTSDEIESFMRALAVKTYHLDPVQDRAALRLWSAHSLRVGACVLLHAMGFPLQDIKWLLRWLSDAFMAYLRNIAVLATRHTRALDKAAAMPNYV